MRTTESNVDFVRDNIRLFCISSKDFSPFIIEPPNSIQVIHDFVGFDPLVRVLRVPQIVVYMFIW